METLDFLFPPEEPDDDVHEIACAALATGNLFITTLSGESATLSYHPFKKILDIKKEVESQLKAPAANQRLLYQNKELKVIIKTFFLLQSIASINMYCMFAFLQNLDLYFKRKKVLAAYLDKHTQSRNTKFYKRIMQFLSSYIFAHLTKLITKTNINQVSRKTRLTTLHVNPYNLKRELKFHRFGKA